MNNPNRAEETMSKRCGLENHYYPELAGITCDLEKNHPDMHRKDNFWWDSKEAAAIQKELEACHGLTQMARCVELRESALTSDLREARELLKYLEWDSFDENDKRFCSFCENYKQKGHSDTCKLSAFLSKSAQQSGEVERDM